MMKNYEYGSPLGEVAAIKKGTFTGNNDLFFRAWYEVNWKQIDFGISEPHEIAQSHYVPMNSGGHYRRWYGNRTSVIKFDRHHYNLIQQKGGHRNPQYYFRKSAAWTKITTGTFSVRISEVGFINNDASMAVYETRIALEILAALLNSKVSQYYLNTVNESLNYTTGNVASIPYKNCDSDIVKQIAKECINISKADWDAFETSWDFKRHPLLPKRNGEQETSADMK